MYIYLFIYYNNSEYYRHEADRALQAGECVRLLLPLLQLPLQLRNPPIKVRSIINDKTDRSYWSRSIDDDVPGG
jgi:hypothetical protein